MQQNANFNTVCSMDSHEILKKYIKEKVLEGCIEEDDELCKRMNRGLIAIADSYDLIGNLYNQNAFAKSKTSKFQKKTKAKKVDDDELFEDAPPEEQRIMTAQDEFNGAQLEYKPITVEFSES